ncbi:hypothetical protein [Microbacterium sp. 10M-3C3]|uniref:hypothetical protein n=1 Tax=Microbacterium sp. 10M-3C3 TaxID=2483401 RepID=UPI0013DDFF10
MLERCGDRPDFEWVQARARRRWTRQVVAEVLRDGMRDAWDVVVVEAERDAITMREAAVRIGVRRVVEAQRLRGIA